MNRQITNKECSLCGKSYNNISFMGGYICQECISFINKLDL